MHVCVCVVVPRATFFVHRKFGECWKKNTYTTHQQQQQSQQKHSHRMNDGLCFRADISEMSQSLSIERCCHCVCCQFLLSLSSASNRMRRLNIVFKRNATKQTKHILRWNYYWPDAFAYATRSLVCWSCAAWLSVLLWRRQTMGQRQFRLRLSDG